MKTVDQLQGLYALESLEPPLRFRFVHPFASKEVSETLAQSGVPFAVFAHQDSGALVLAYAKKYSLQVKQELGRIAEGLKQTGFESQAQLQKLNANRGGTELSSISNLSYNEISALQFFASIHKVNYYSEETEQSNTFYYLPDEKKTVYQALREAACFLSRTQSLTEEKSAFFDQCAAYINQNHPFYICDANSNLFIHYHNGIAETHLNQKSNVLEGSGQQLLNEVGKQMNSISLPVILEEDEFDENPEIRQALAFSKLNLQERQTQDQIYVADLVSRVVLAANDVNRSISSVSQIPSLEAKVKHSNLENRDQLLNLMTEVRNLPPQEVENAIQSIQQIVHSFSERLSTEEHELELPILERNPEELE